ncbi:MAG: Gfo/Idh/MocA family oxidoreductase [Kiritimatiellaeota bacterium]|nr:Gfo/Idh/MocA family oxidoreductase [Kiritimatiellota bacterium]
MNKIRIGIIGCGVIAPGHLASYRKLADVELAWACDLVEAKARQMAAEYNIARITTDFRKVLQDKSVTGVSICTDHASHAPLTVAALKAGKHVLCEKALSSTTAKMNAMMAAHAKHPELVFAGVFQHRFDPVARYVKRLVDEGTFGTILTAGIQVRCLRTNAYYQGDAWRGTWAGEGGSVLINQAIHFIDAIAWIMGGVESVCGTCGNLTHQGVIETEDTATAALRFKSGALGTIEATCSSHFDWETTLSIHGVAGSVEVRNNKPVKIVFGDKALMERVQAEMTAIIDKPALNVGKSYYGTGHPAQIADFVDAIRSHRLPFIPAASARHTVEIVLAIYKSHRTGRRVVVKN